MSKNQNRVAKIFDCGQSIWCDNVDRHAIEEGVYQRLIQEDKLRGVTSNPTIFQKAIAKGGVYDNDLTRLAAEGLSPEDVCWSIIVKDIQDVADIFKEVYEESKQTDGYVSIEVSPFLANDTEGTIKQANELWKRVNRSNVMIKIPATKAGLPAITSVIASGINVNVTLIFSLARYREVMAAHIKGLAQRVASGQPVGKISSVASFFVSRVDSEADKQIDAAAKQAPDKQAELSKFLGQIAIANSKVAYAEFEQVYGSDTFKSLKQKGAQVQRPLWASTSTKNPKYRDVMYVEELIGPYSVNTVPPPTIDAFRDHGNADIKIQDGLREAQATLEAFKRAGFSLDKITDQLEEAGVKSFSDSFRDLINSVKEREAKLGSKSK